MAMYNAYPLYVAIPEYLEKNTVHDCALISRGRRVVYTSRILLAAHSEFLTKCMLSRPVVAYQYAISLPDASYSSIKLLVKMLSSGEVGGTRAELEELSDLAEVLQIKNSERWRCSMIPVNGVNRQRRVVSPLLPRSGFSQYQQSNPQIRHQKYADARAAKRRRIQQDLEIPTMENKYSALRDHDYHC